MYEPGLPKKSSSYTPSGTVSKFPMSLSLIDEPEELQNHDASPAPYTNNTKDASQTRYRLLQRPKDNGAYPRILHSSNTQNPLNNIEAPSEKDTDYSSINQGDSKDNEPPNYAEIQEQKSIERAKSFEERSKDYQEVRARIFNENFEPQASGDYKDNILLLNEGYNYYTSSPNNVPPMHSGRVPSHYPPYDIHTHYAQPGCYPNFPIGYSTSNYPQFIPGAIPPQQHPSLSNFTQDLNYFPYLMSANPPFYLYHNPNYVTLPAALPPGNQIYYNTMVNSNPPHPMNQNHYPQQRKPRTQFSPNPPNNLSTSSNVTSMNNTGNVRNINRAPNRTPKYDRKDSYNGSTFSPVNKSLFEPSQEDLQLYPNIIKHQKKIYLNTQNNNPRRKYDHG